jgi:hypothetical protein
MDPSKLLLTSDLSVAELDLLLCIAAKTSHYALDKKDHCTTSGTQHRHLFRFALKGVTSLDNIFLFYHFGRLFCIRIFRKFGVAVPSSSPGTGAMAINIDILVK